MVKKSFGFQKAVELLSRLREGEKSSILEKISQQDQGVSDALRENLLQFNDLLYLTPDMIRTLTRQVPMDKFGLAFRAASPDLINHFRSHVSKGSAQDMDDVLHGPLRRLEDVTKAQEEILDIVRDLIAKGQIVIDKEGLDKMV